MDSGGSGSLEGKVKCFSCCMPSGLPDYRFQQDFNPIQGMGLWRINRFGSGAAAALETGNRGDAERYGIFFCC